MLPHHPSVLAPRQTALLTVDPDKNDSCDACEPPSFPRDVKEALKPSIQSPIQHQWLSATAITHVRPHTDHTFWTVVPDQFPVFSSPSLHLQVRAGLIVRPLVGVSNARSAHEGCGGGGPHVPFNPLQSLSATWSNGRGGRQAHSANRPIQLASSESPTSFFLLISLSSASDRAD